MTATLFIFFPIIGQEPLKQIMTSLYLAKENEKKNNKRSSRERTFFFTAKCTHLHTA